MTRTSNPTPPREVPPAPPVPGKVDPIPPEMPVPGVPEPEDAPPPVPHPPGPPTPAALADNRYSFTAPVREET